MFVFSRAAGRRDVIRAAGAILGVVWLGLLATFAYSMITVQPTAAGIAAAVAALLIAGAGFLYAWRVPRR